jgi:hypothetical protein
MPLIDLLILMMPDEMSCIAEAPACLLPELLYETDSVSSFKAEYLHLLLEAAKTEIELDEGMALLGTDESMVLVGMGDRRREAGLLSLSFLSLPLSLSLLVGSKPNPISVAYSPCSFIFPFKFAHLFPLPEGAGIFEAAP